MSSALAQDAFSKVGELNREYWLARDMVSGGPIFYCVEKTLVSLLMLWLKIQGYRIPYSGKHRPPRSVRTVLNKF